MQLRQCSGVLILFAVIILPRIAGGHFLSYEEAELFSYAESSFLHWNCWQNRRAWVLVDSILWCLELPCFGSVRENDIFLWHLQVFGKSLVEGLLEKEAGTCSKKTGFLLIFFDWIANSDPLDLSTSGGFFPLAKEAFPWCRTFFWSILQQGKHSPTKNSVSISRMVLWNPVYGLSCLMNMNKRLLDA